MHTLVGNCNNRSIAGNGFVVFHTPRNLMVSAMLPATEFPDMFTHVYFCFNSDFLSAFIGLFRQYNLFELISNWFGHI